MWVGPNCQWTGVHGVIRAANGLPLQGVQVSIRDEAGRIMVSEPTNADGIYSLFVGDGLQTGTWYLQVLENSVPASGLRGVVVGGGCVNGVQEVKADWQRLY